jgi:signal transduction histidine kinase
LFAEHPCKERCGLFSKDIAKPIFARQCLIRAKDGREVYISKNADLLRDEKGNAIGGIETFEDISERKRLEAEIDKVSESERQRIGRDLHDGLGQSLTAIGYLASAVQTELARKAAPEAADMGKLVGQIQKTLRQAHEMARGLFPDVLMPGGIMPALEDLAHTTWDLFGIRCRVSGPRKTVIPDAAVARELYRIAQEAVNNAVRHSHGQRVWIRLQPRAHTLVLTVRDNGQGLRKRTLARTDMGLHIMQYRADIIGASLRVDSVRGKGTTVTCVLPLSPLRIRRQTP